MAKQIFLNQSALSIHFFSSLKKENHLCYGHLFFITFNMAALDRITYFISQKSSSTFPFVCVTFAQSIDGSIGIPGEHVIISGPDSMQMTHSLRAIHDSILIGVGTLIQDNPRLTVRLIEGKKICFMILNILKRIRFFFSFVKISSMIE